MSDAANIQSDWRDPIKISDEMASAGEAVLADLEGEADRLTLAKEIYWAMEWMRRSCAELDNSLKECVNKNGLAAL